MKNKLYIFILLFLILGCSSDDDQNLTSDPVQQLPEATQVGANTAGALVNGEPITPQGGGITPNLTAYYQLIDGEYYFSVRFFKATNNNTIITGLEVASNELVIEPNNTYPLNITPTPSEVGAGGVCNKSVLNVSQTSYYTQNGYTGELTITHLDETNRIVSGTFWFDAVNEDGEVVEVREGRFDVTYSQ